LFRCKLVYTLMFGGLASFYPFMTLYFEQQGVSSVQIGILRAVATVVSIVASPSWGMVADSMQGARAWVFLGLLVCGTAVRISLLGAHTFWALFFTVLISESLSSPVAPQFDAATMSVVNRSRAVADLQRLGHSLVEDGNGVDSDAEKGNQGANAPS